jgi:hypothetical protein
MAHIMVCTPMYGGMATGHYVQSLLALTGQFLPLGTKSHARLCSTSH